MRRHDDRGGPPDRTAWIEAVLAKHERSLVRYAARLLHGDLERARDVAQEALLRLCKERYEDVEGREAEWLHRVARNLAIDVRRKESRMTALTDEDSQRTDERAGRPGEALEHRDQVAHVLGRLESLPEKQREALRLKFQSGLSYREIAGVMDESVGNVGWLIHMGIKGLRGRLAAEGAEL